MFEDEPVMEEEEMMLRMNDLEREQPGKELLKPSRPITDVRTRDRWPRCK
jgi:hypothetical protein